MQTFLPYPDFKESARVLDRQRLGKQRIETLQILNVLCNNYQFPFNGMKSNVPWGGHPAVKMWWTYENHLIDYGLAICDEWILRGYKDTCREKILKYQKLAPNGFKGMPVNWLGNENFHSSHRAALLFKNPEYYSQFGWKENPIKKYWWPTKNLDS